jgi:hypothetical protein
MSADSTAGASSQLIRRARVAILENAIGLACTWRATRGLQDRDAVPARRCDRNTIGCRNLYHIAFEIISNTVRDDNLIGPSRFGRGCVSNSLPEWLVAGTCELRRCVCMGPCAHIFSRPRHRALCQPPPSGAGEERDSDKRTMGVDQFDLNEIG